ncbi:hypothetical protein [Pseudomonas kilonensis]|uniref:hypothetical protein n=1 Tax=Pseudomonas kilonensis TaxID=132476 RepID=UPI00209FBF41|nr:hypothetical protein [Pseudomonas kilonensis]MCP1455509.1 hypothetical protein [Pseudomonas kilonensis]
MIGYCSVTRQEKETPWISTSRTPDASLVSHSKIQKKATQMSGFFLPEVYVLRREPSLVYRALSNIEPKICYRRNFLERQETLHA